MRQMKLLNLIKNNLEAPGKRFEIVASADREATVYLYDVIDNWYGIDSESFVKGINALDVDVIHLRINSPGGDVFDARTMYTALKQHKAQVMTHIDGLSASAATYVGLAGDHVEITDGGFFMIHKGWTITLGNADDYRKTAGILDKVDASIARDYAKKTGLDETQLLAWMSEEKWMDATESKELGFVDSIYDGEGIANSFDLSVYDHIPEKLSAAQRPPETNQKPVFNARTPLIQRLAELHQ